MMDKVDPTPKREIHKTFPMKTFPMTAEEVLSVPIFGTEATPIVQKEELFEREEQSK